MKPLTKTLYLTLILCIHLTIIADTVKIPLPDLNRPESIQIDDERIFITENASIYIYQNHPFRLIKKFGKAGEGPREFKINKQQLANLYLDVKSEQVFVHSMGKVSWFKKDGSFLRENKFSVNPSLYDTRLFGNHYTGIFISQDKKRYRGIRAYDRKQNLLKEVIRNPDVFQYGKGMDIFKYPTAFDIDGDRMYLAWESEFVIRVIDQNYKPLKTIRHPYDRVKVTEKDRQATIESFKKNPTTRDFLHILKPFKFAEYFPAIHSLFANGGKLYVTTHKKKNDLRELLIFDEKGRLLKSSYFPLQMQDTRQAYPFSIYKGKIYQLVEDIDREEWSLWVTDQRKL